ncbi:MAG: ribulose-phosphate 3-epimerase [Firmicutes bacterium]|nr:ribulose-phosphate 3-epimerase [Bacillota bacterium]
MKVAPSLLAADFARLGEAAQEAEAAGADLLHIDVMDGHFVPPITVGQQVVAAIRRLARIPLDVHLMVANPERHLASFREAGADIITVHAEVCPHLHRVLGAIRDLGARAGVAFNPATAPDVLPYVADLVDLVLVMTVNPGYGGQALIPATLQKVAQVSRLREQGWAGEIEVDGGITPDTAPPACRAGATILVAGTAVFGTPDYAAAIRALRASACAAPPGPAAPRTRASTPPAAVPPRPAAPPGPGSPRTRASAPGI